MNELMEDIRIINEMARKLNMKKNPDYDFEDFLLYKAFENGCMDKDEAFDHVDGLPVENIIQYANEFAEQCVRRATA